MGPPDTCESCGSSGEDLEPVRRVYLAITGGRLEPVGVDHEVERWCPSCRATYPHEPAAPTRPGEAPEPGTPEPETEPERDR